LTGAFKVLVKRKLAEASKRKFGDDQ
jgi:hypothetical protein